MSSSGQFMVMLALAGLLAAGTAVYARTITVKNVCSFDINMEAARNRNGSSAAKMMMMIGEKQQLGGSWNQPAGESRQFNITEGWSGYYRANGGTKAEFTFAASNGRDSYDISVMDGYNVAITLSNNKGCQVVKCFDKNCPDAYHYNSDQKAHSCVDADYVVTYC